ncbi:MAG TPA: cob(I)yrinic acid a,c-diamide adenosyltransferase [Bacteroidota bacterium]|nr:cob(I)yrinic acid a,c-diamide adenosyltransferase [Bacteroidota bacterium]
MKIYTKTGDSGETGLFGGDRVPKDSPRIEAYGAVDELNSLIGVVRSRKLPEKVDALLLKIQRDLFTLGADLATRRRNKRTLIPHIAPVHALSLERSIDSFQRELPQLESFILPGGSDAGSALHLARTVCRRAEVLTVRLSRSEKIEPAVLVYLNRLSDLLFVLARYSNQSEHKKEVQWKNPSKKK